MRVGRTSLPGHRLALSAAIALSLAATLPHAGGCYRPEDTFVDVPVGSGDTVGQGGAGGTTSLTAEEYFEANVKQGLVENCSGADCHSSGAVAFLLSGNEYASITTYKSSVGLPLIVEDPDTSLLITYPGDPEHPGIPWDGLEELRANVLTWLEMEAVHIDPELLLQVGPIQPDGLTVVSLSALGQGLSGVTMTFYASAVGNPVTSLLLSQMAVWPPNGRGVRLEDPTFVVAPPGKPERPNTSLHGDAYVMVAPDDVTLASGELVLTDWEPGAKLYIRFASVAALYADPNGNTFEPCSRVDLFTDAVDALPLQSASNAPNGLLYCADKCHGGSDANAVAKMDLAELLSTPRDDDQACAKVRLNITPSSPDTSTIITITEPPGTGHPFAFGGNATSHGAFKSAMTPWITAEGQ